MDKKREELFLQSYKEHTDELYRYCFFKVMNKEEAKDFVQEAFVRTWDYLRKGGEVVNIRAFLYRTAHNIIIDSFRKKKSLSLDDLFDAGFDTDAGAEHVKDLHNIIDGKEAMKLLDLIPKAYRDVIYMHYVDGLSVKEMGEVLGESSNNVSVKLHRGMDRLRKIFQNPSSPSGQAK
jgi:RNA polymerase sigma-70 factor (ECF subfamily)